MESKRQQKHWKFYAAYGRIHNDQVRTEYWENSMPRFILLPCYLTYMQIVAFHFKEHIQECGIFKCQQDSLVNSFTRKP